MTEKVAESKALDARVFSGRVMHARLDPVSHRFEYPVYWYSFDVDKLPELSKKLKTFGHNKIRLVSIHDEDYLSKEPGSIREKLMKFLEKAGVSDDVSRIELVTSARYFNYVFNPVSFYYCYRADGRIRCMVAEVNNTFYEKHLYILDYQKEPRRGFLTRYTVSKEFHVSPFNEVTGEYDFHFSELGDSLDIRIDILREGKPVFLSRMWGDSVAMSNATILKTILKFPITASLSIPRIYWQAARLRFQRKLPYINKPNPESGWTVQVAPPTWWERFCMRFVLQFIETLDRGELVITYPDGTVKRYGKDNGEPAANMRLRNYAIFPRLLRDGGIGLGESFQLGDWESDDVARVVFRFLDNTHCIPEPKLNLLKPFRWALRLEHHFRRNSLTNSKKNIQAHYDLSNDFFKVFLDPSLTYSSALFRTPEDTLQQAQANKIDSIIKKACIPQDGELLEIGSGWGALALEATRRHNCKVTSVSLSTEQLAIARERAKESGTPEKLDFRFQDYRKIEGKFDSIVSVEMMEAVGHKYLGEFFGAIDRLLKPNGVAVLQVIAYPDFDYREYLKRQDWIQRHIFPGSHLPSLNAMVDAVAKRTKLMVESVENIGPHYALTLRAWHKIFNERVADIKALGYDNHFIRTWQFYFASCEAEFSSRWLNVYQIVLTRPNNGALIADFAKRHPA